MQQVLQPNQTDQRLFAFGLGYSAQVLVRRLSAKGWQCAGSVRTAEKAARLNTVADSVVVFDSTEAKFQVPAGSHWLISVPPGDAGCPVFVTFKDQASKAATITYLSTTGVYGDLQGGWAFEWSTVSPMSKRGKRRALAERQWASIGRPFRTVRLPGIYGPGRSPFKRLREGHARRIIKSGQVFSRIHVDDIASGLEAMMLRPGMTGVFHLCDDHPAPPQAVTLYAAELAGLTVPEPVDFAVAELSPMARSFYSECKRVSNARAKSALGWSPVYKDYKSGLKQVLQAETDRRNQPTPLREITP